MARSFVVEASALLPHSPATVFAAAASVEGAVRWQGGVCDVRRIPADRGTRTGALLLGYRALGRRHALVARLTVLDPPRRFAFRAEHDALAIETTVSVDEAPGGARVRYQLALDTTDLALRRLVARRAARDLVRLAEWVVARERLADTPVAAG